MGMPSDAALLAELGGASDVKPESADDILRSLGLDPNKGDEDLSDAALLGQLEAATDPIQIARDLQEEIDNLKAEAKGFA